MSDTTTATQFSVFLVNKPGVLAQVTRALAEAKLNLVAMTLVDSQEHGVLRMVVENEPEARKVLAKLNLPMTETEVVCLDLSNRPGALADVAQLLGENHININYAYCTSGAPGGRTTGVFKVADLNKARHVLDKAGAKLSHKEPTGRRATGRR
jgi:hypothetical protein